MSSPSRDAELLEVRALAACCRDDRQVTKVDDLVDRFDISKARVQRLFARNVGVGPKWVIQRYRLHEALARLDGTDVVDHATLALDLGYFDQAHFIRDFKAVVGCPPRAFARGDLTHGRRRAYTQRKATIGSIPVARRAGR
jgi:AraC-like DNA-binding protein